jgi:hypothetical protein
MPRAFLVYRSITVPDADAALALLSSGIFDWRRSVILEENGPSGLRGEVPELSEATTDRYEQRRVEVSVLSAAAGMLVFTDAYYPGWRALVDDVPVPLFRADYVFRAVPVPAGRHRVTMVYEAPAFRLGAAVSAGTLLALGSWAVLGLGRYWLAGTARARLR